MLHPPTYVCWWNGGLPSVSSRQVRVFHRFCNTAARLCRFTTAQTCCCFPCFRSTNHDPAFFVRFHQAHMFAACQVYQACACFSGVPSICLLFLSQLLWCTKHLPSFLNHQAQLFAVSWVSQACACISQSLPSMCLLSQVLPTTNVCCFVRITKHVPAFSQVYHACVCRANGNTESKLD